MAINENGISRRQFVFLGTAATMAAFGLTACSGSGGSGSGSGSAGGSLKDGTYTGKSAVHDDGVEGDGYGIISVTVENGKISNVEFQAYEVDDTPKDKDYGKDGAYYAVAQKAISAGDSYAADLLETGTVEGVDAVSGATLLYDQFIEAAEDALAQAK